ncbi:MAG: SGNH/GDSL hydrolase family protein [Ruminococcaceae bacterium]|nr:SGNH/GDSL hydrolase family protein [Oscillospiraceae bacterium]
MEKNTVDSKNQLKDSKIVRFKNLDGKGKRIMFVGNSITLHGILHEIGWHNEWGMAASKEENDYVHILMNKICENRADSQFCICQVSEWEREYKCGETKFEAFENARDFDADVIIMRFIENVPGKDFEPIIFKDAYDKLLGFLNKSKNAKIILTTGFWKHPGDSVIIEYAKENGLPCVTLGDLGEDDSMKALGLFEHSGVANHPGDLGMKNIADRIYSELLKIL